MARRVKSWLLGGSVPGLPGLTVPPVMTPAGAAGRLGRGGGAGEQQGDVVARARGQVGEHAVAQVV